MENFRSEENIKKFKAFFLSSAKIEKGLRFLAFGAIKGKIYMVFIDEKGAKKILYISSLLIKKKSLLVPS